MYYFPFRYLDKSRFYSIRELEGEMPAVQIRGRFLQLELRRTKVARIEDVRRRITTDGDRTDGIACGFPKRQRRVEELLRSARVRYILRRTTYHGSNDRRRVVRILRHPTGRPVTLRTDPTPNPTDVSSEVVVTTTTEPTVPDVTGTGLRVSVTYVRTN